MKKKNKLLTVAGLAVLSCSSLAFISATSSDVVVQTVSSEEEKGEIATWKGFRTAASSFTFDDGLPCHITDVAPMFEKYGYRATFNLVTNWTSQAKTWSSFASLASKGHEIGSHSDSHGLNMTGEEASSKKTIETNIGLNIPCLTVAYPNCNVPNKD